eukprot:comp12693_c0_seq2/m.7789 comp12693_c0_seq2/g.7789  ORF comp12693_c0_seq2/g.7789 comp12693_c0_seq2/m.7789 type:complete len:290 (-) comp12693_c0_seq2:400-1269(-)
MAMALACWSAAVSRIVPSTSKRVFQPVGLRVQQRTYADMAAPDLFGRTGQAQNYAIYRPRYTASLLGRIMQTQREDRRDKMVDIACGNGQVLAGLASNFKKAYGYDRSEAQLQHACVLPNVTYGRADALAIPLDDSSVDLVTIGQALHWLPLPAFFSEVKRLLRPGGQLAVLGYGTCSIEGCREANGVFSAYYRSLSSYWDCNREQLDLGFGQDEFPFEHVQRVWECDVRTMPVGDFGRYLDTWSAYRTWKAKHPGEEDILAALLAKLQPLVGPTVEVSFPYFLVLAAT